MESYNNNLNQDNLSIFNGFLSPGTYRFKLNLKHKNGTILNVFENKLDLNKNGYLFQGSLVLYSDESYGREILSFKKRQDYNRVIYIQKSKILNIESKSSYGDIGIKNIRINDIVLFTWETIEKRYNDKQDYIIDNTFINECYQNNIFRYSTLEIYKKNYD